MTRSPVDAGDRKVGVGPLPANRSCPARLGLGLRVWWATRRCRATADEIA
jgi:hypothetical protein